MDNNNTNKLSIKATTLRSADSPKTKFTVQLLELTQETLIGMDVTTRTHQSQGFRESHTSLDHEESQRARRWPWHSHEAMY